MSKKPKTLSDQLREAVSNAGVTRYRMAQDLDITEGQLSRFVHGDCGLSIRSIDMLGEYLGLRIVAEGQEKKAKGR